MRHGTSRILHANGGQALVETTMVLTLLTVMLLGVFEFSRAIQANNIIANMSREAANLATRSSSAPQDIMDAVGSTAQPLDMTDHGMIIITTVQGGTGSQAGKVVVTNNSQAIWSKGGYVIDSRVTTNGLPPNSSAQPCLTTIPDGTLKPGEVAHVAEVFYDYQLSTTGPLPMKPNLYSMTIF